MLIKVSNGIECSTGENISLKRLKSGKIGDISESVASTGELV